MAINLSTKSEELIRVLKDETSKAQYWLKKHFNGDKGYERMRDDLLWKAKHYKKAQRSELVEYKSKQGNRWLVFEEARYYPQSGYAFSMPYAFCYYETLGSVGMFIQAYDPNDESNTVVLIFTSHFFLRWCDSQRKMGTMMGRKTIVDFLAMFDGMVLHPYVDDNGRKCVDVRICNTLGRGVVRNDNDKVFEIKTPLTDKMLSSAQRKFTKEMREVSDIAAKYNLPPEVRLTNHIAGYNKAKINGNEEEFMENLYADMAKVVGISTENMKDASMWITATNIAFFKIADKDIDYLLTAKYATEFTDSAMTLKEAHMKGATDHEIADLMCSEIKRLESKIHIGMTDKQIDNYFEHYKKYGTYAT